MTWDIDPPADGNCRTPTPDGCVVDLWLIDLDADQAVDATVFTTAEVERAERYRFERDRRRFIAGRWAQRRIMAAGLGVDVRSVSFAGGVQDKPKPLVNEAPAPLAMSYSRSAEVGALAIAADGALGIDIEAIEPVAEASLVAGRHFTPGERSALRRACRSHEGSGDAGDPRSFLQIWSAKEAALKALGIGLAGDLASLDASAAVTGPTTETSSAHAFVIRALAPSTRPQDGGDWQARALTFAGRGGRNAGFLACIVADRPVNAVAIRWFDEAPGDVVMKHR
ncbi:MAG: 4'-phosphopantetheinyl transferase superfamily protein [Alphaproteobacteria bacterium]|nr:4'-phosphopantetheinyl transferase superfamily protein [Alphaproteobacteria bacterium]